jgi:hypothetical protein
MRTTLILASFLAAACGENLTHPLPAYEGGPVTTLPCLPDLDGSVVAAELAPSLSVTASYIVTPYLPVTATEGRSVDVVGRVGGDGRRVWDWSGIDTDAVVGTLAAAPLSTQWYVAHFPEGEYSVPMDFAGRLHAVYSHDEDGLWLHGTASAEADPTEGKTLLVYSEPVQLFPFPFVVGSSWTEVGEIRNGTIQGLTPWSQDDTYEVEVDAAGELVLPDFTFTQALRVRTRVSLAPKTGTTQPTVQRQASFVCECFGEVARATSLVAFPPQPDPPEDFTQALEIRKLGWF